MYVMPDGSTCMGFADSGILTLSTLHERTCRCIDACALKNDILHHIVCLLFFFLFFGGGGQVTIYNQPLTNYTFKNRNEAYRTYTNACAWNSWKCYQRKRRNNFKPVDTTQNTSNQPQINLNLTTIIFWPIFVFQPR